MTRPDDTRWTPPEGVGLEDVVKKAEKKIEPIIPVKIVEEPKIKYSLKQKMHEYYTNQLSNQIEHDGLFGDFKCFYYSICEVLTR